MIFLKTYRENLNFFVEKNFIKFPRTNSTQIKKYHKALKVIKFFMKFYGKFIYGLTVNLSAGRYYGLTVNLCKVRYYGLTVILSSNLSYIKKTVNVKIYKIYREILQKVTVRVSKVTVRPVFQKVTVGYKLSSIQRYLYAVSLLVFSKNVVENKYEK